MAKKPADPGDDAKPADFGDEKPSEKQPEPAFDAKDAEIERLRKELADARAVRAPAPPGRYTCSVKDGPTVTLETKHGERPEDAFLTVCGIHSTPHRIEVHEAGPDAALGVHLPNGTVKPLTV